jgi:hypothetical protein
MRWEKYFLPGNVPGQQKGESVPVAIASPSMEKLSLWSFNRALDTYERLIEMYLTGEALHTPTIVDLFKQWIKNLLSWLQQLIQHMVLSSDELYQRVAMRLLKNIARLGLDAKTLAAHLKPIHEWYLAGAKQHARDEFFAQEYIQPQETQTWVRTASRFTLRGYYLTQVLIPHLEKDIDELKQWGNYTFRAVLTHVDEKVAMDAYLEAYRHVRLKVSQWRGVILEVRKKEEALLREKKDYLERLHQLDEKLTALSNKMTAVEAGWLTELNETAIFHREAIQEANDKYFKAFQRPEVKKLAWVEWVHHTCCDFRSTEGWVMPEMYAKNKEKGGQYFLVTNYAEEHMERVYTMTDYAVSQLSAASTGVKRMMVPLHPDKLSRASLKGISEYCTHTLTEMRQKSVRIGNAWQRSQWGEASEQGLVSLDVYTEEEAAAIAAGEPPPIQHLEPVVESLDIDVFETLHKDYLAFMESRVRPGLIKTVHDKIEIPDRLYEGPEEERYTQVLHIFSKELHRSVILRNQKLNKVIAERQQEINATELETSEARQEALKIQIKIKKAMMQFLFKNLSESSFLQLAAATDDQFNQGVEQVVETVYVIFEEERAEIRTLLFQLLSTEPRFQAFAHHVRCSSEAFHLERPSAAAMSSLQGLFFDSAIQPAGDDDCPGVPLEVQLIE